MSKRQRWWGLLFILPWLIGFVCLTLGPMIASLVLSFYHYNPGEMQFAGLTNYQRMLTEDPYFWSSLWRTMLYTLFAVPLGLSGSLLLAVLLNQNLRAKGLWRACFYIPTLVPAVAASFIWKYLFNQHFGLVNRLLADAGMPKEQLPQWFESSSLALPTLVLMSLWGIGGARMIIFLAGLQNIPASLYEAASIDGASRWQQFRHVTLPMLSPVIFFNLILGAIGAFQVFTQAFLITSGGPVNATLFYALYLFRKAFQQFEMGYASALAWAFFVVLGILTAIQFWASKKWVHYEAE